MYNEENERPLSKRYGDYKRSSKISYPFFLTPPKNQNDFQEICSGILNAFTNGCEVHPFIGKLFDLSLQYPGLKEKTIEIFILSTSRNLSLLYPRDKNLESKFLEISKALLDSTLTTFEKAKAISEEVFQKKENGFKQLRLDMIEKETPLPEKMSLPNLIDDITFNSTEIINNPLDEIDKVLREILDTENHFNRQLKHLIGNPIFQLHQHHKDYQILLTASNCLIETLSKGQNEKERFLSVLDAFSADHSHPYFLAFKIPIQVGNEVCNWMKVQKMDASDILIAPMQRVIKIKLLLERLDRTLHEGRAKCALNQRIQNVEKWLTLFNLL